ncbi:MAG: hypothetical protein IRZ07_28785 [Microbispora sp.]|nr:hypothetical protein [Microbispora sp.]
MSTPADFAAAAQALAAALRAATDDPADQVRLLAALAAFAPPAAGDPAGDLCRRAALTELARATADYRAASYEEAVALRDMVCGLLSDEEIRAADQGEDATFGAFRALRIAVARDLTARAADLARLRTVQTAAPLPALVLANKLYGDAGRAEELTEYAGAANPLFLPTRFRARER